MMKIHLLILLLSITSIRLYAGEPVPDSLLFTDSLLTEKWMKEKNIPVVGIGYIENGEIKEVSVYGLLEKNKPAPVNTIFNVASLTKPVTAMVAMKLINAGQWELDEPLSKYWTDPDVAGDSLALLLTTRHILSHQSGFPNWRGSSPDKKLHFEFVPGTKYQYSGEGFEYLRKALENKFKKPLNDLAEELIFNPLGMNETRFFWDENVDESRFARWHSKEGTIYKTYKNDQSNAADDLLTTVGDYTKFMLHIMNGAGLSDELFREMTSMQVRIGQEKYFGLGWWIDENVDDDQNAMLHGGDDIGVHTMAIILPGKKQGLLIFTSCDNGTDIYIPAVLHYLEKAGQRIIDIETNR